MALIFFHSIEVLVRVINLSLQLRLIIPTSTSIILDITKTSSNNCISYSINRCCSHCLINLSDESFFFFFFLFEQDDPNLQVAIKSCKNPESREKFLEEACKYFLSQND